jgi:hypothetical protein
MEGSFVCLRVNLCYICGKKLQNSDNMQIVVKNFSKQFRFAE